MRKGLFLGLLAVMAASWWGCSNLGLTKRNPTSVRAAVESFTFQTIEGGSFTMGSPRGEAGRDNDEQQKEHVIISKTFEIMTTEVTQRQWFEVMRKNPSKFKKSKYCDNHDIIDGHELCPTNPVEGVSWDEVQIFIKKLNDSLGLSGCHGTPQDKKGCYRLPTEAEWEFAARGGTVTAYSFGDDDSRLGDYAWYAKNSGGRTHQVEKRERNPSGLFDMHGNVWEWVQDSYHEKFPDRLDDPPHNSSGSNRVIRGGGWPDRAWNLRSADRDSSDPSSRGSGVGFRLVRTL